MDVMRHGLGMTQIKPERKQVPHFDNSWDWSSVISFMTLMVGGIVAFVRIKAKTENLDQDIKDIRQQIEKVEANAVDAQAKSEGRIMQYLQDMRADTREIKEDIREIRAAQLRKN